MNKRWMAGNQQPLFCFSFSSHNNNSSCISIVLFTAWLTVLQKPQFVNSAMSQPSKAVLFVFTSAEKLLNGAVRVTSHPLPYLSLVPANDWLFCSRQDGIFLKPPTRTTSFPHITVLKPSPLRVAPSLSTKPLSRISRTKIRRSFWKILKLKNWSKTPKR